MRFDFRDAALMVDADAFPQNFETSKQAKIARQHVVTALEQAGNNGRRLACRLEMCRQRPCRSAACPSCRRYFRLWWASEISRYMAVDPDYWFTVSIVPPDLFFPSGELDRFNWNNVKDRFRKQV